ncbi:MAG TPA: glycosyltransferase [Thermoanaerobaculia bacterium]
MPVPDASRPIRRVAILGPSPPDRGGIARETRLLADELSRRADVGVRWLTFSRPYPRWLDPRRFDRDPALPPSAAEPLLDWASPLSWKQTAMAVAGSAGAEALTADGTQALLVPWWTSFWALPLRSVLRHVRRLSPETRRVLICHNVEEHESGAFRRFLSIGAMTAADAFVCQSEADRALLALRAPGRPACVLPHPVVRTGPIAVSRGEARARVGVAGDGPLVLFLGLVRRYKGVDLLLDAAPEIARRTGARIAIVGEVFPDARDTMKRVSASPVRDRLIVHDAYVPEETMETWLAACDVVVLPYRAISGSGIAARAIAAARPMAASAVGGLRDAVVPGATGELFASGDAAALAAAVQTVLARGVDAYAPGLAEAAERHSWTRYVDALMEFLSGLGRR